MSEQTAGELVDPQSILIALSQIGSGIRRSIATQAKIDLSINYIAADFDKQITALRKQGCIKIDRQTYSLTDKGRARLLPHVYLCGIVTQGATFAVLVTDREQAAEINRRMQVHSKAPASFMLSLKIDDISALPDAFRPGGVEPLPMLAAAQPVLPRVLHTVRLTQVTEGKWINVIKVIREITSLGLREAKQVVDQCIAGNAPIITDKATSHDEVTGIIRRIEEAGGRASWRAEDDRPAPQMMHQVMLCGCTSETRISVIRAIREHTGYDLITAKNIVDKAVPGLTPAARVPIKEMLTEHAERLRDAVKQAGGEVTWDPAHDRQV